MKNYIIEIKWGIIFTVAGLIWMTFEKLMGWHDELIAKHAIYTNFFAIIAIAIFVFGIRDKKYNYYNGKMSWKQGFVAGLIITITVALLSPVSQYITSEIISPDYFNNVIEITVENNRMSRENAEAYFNLRSYIVQAIFGALAMGTVTSAAIAWFLKTKQKAEVKA